MGFALIPPPAFVVKGCITENSIATSSTLLLEVENIHTNKEDHWIFIGPDWFKLVRNTKYQSEKLYKSYTKGSSADMTNFVQKVHHSQK